MKTTQTESYARALRADIRNWTKVRADWVDRAGGREDIPQVAECNAIIAEAYAELAKVKAT